MQAGWLGDLTAWLKDAIVKLFNAFVDLFKDLLIFGIEKLLDLFATIVEAIQMPDFFNGTSICGLLGQGGPVMSWVMGILHLPEAFVMLAAAVTFRLLRKALTLFQW